MPVIYISRLMTRVIYNHFFIFYILHSLNYLTCVFLFRVFLDGSNFWKLYKFLSFMLWVFISLIVHYLIVRNLEELSCLQLSMRSDYICFIMITIMIIYFYTCLLFGVSVESSCFFLLFMLVWLRYWILSFHIGVVKVELLVVM